MESNLFVFFKYLSLTKLWNILLVALSYGFSLLLKRSIVWGQPFFLHIETTNFCNLKCLECPTGMGILTRLRGVLTFEQFQKFFIPLKDRLIYLVLYFQGEPFLNPDLLRMISLAHKNRVYTMVSTNGHYLQDEEKLAELLTSGLGTLVVSLDGVSQQTYQKYRQNGDLSKVLDGLRRLLQMRQKLRSRYPKIYLQFLVMRHNEHEILILKSLANEQGVDRVLIKTAQIYDFDQAEEILPQNPEYRRYEKVEGKYQLKGRMPNRCPALWSDSLITWDGRVLPCCFDKNAEHEMGFLDSELPDLKDSLTDLSSREERLNAFYRNKFLSIWHGQVYQNYRRQLLQERKAIEICRNCNVGVKIFVETE